MNSSYPLSEANPTDSEAIASLFALSWTSPFTQLQFGHVEPSSLAAAMAPRIAQHMEKPNIRFIVARHPEMQEVTSVAQWALPAAGREGADRETPEEKEERQKFEDEAYRKKLPENSNKDLIMEFTVGLRKLRQETLQGRKHYLLENIATHPDHRCKGLASKLIEWVFPDADEQSVLIYLDTGSDNNAMRLYKKLGFEERGSHTIEDLTKFVTPEEFAKYRGDKSETHVALIRYPKSIT